MAVNVLKTLPTRKLSALASGQIIRPDRSQLEERCEALENSAIELFAGKRILIVEDEYFLADETRRKLEKAGATVVGPVAGVTAALDLVENEKIDAAILDVHLEGEFVFPVAEELERRNIPFVFATAFDPAIIPVKFTGFSLCEKPTELEKIAEALFGGKSAEYH